MFTCRCRDLIVIVITCFCSDTVFVGCNQSRDKVSKLMFSKRAYIRIRIHTIVFEYHDTLQIYMYM